MRHVVCFSVSFSSTVLLISSLLRHASIDPATRAERGLPEDLIRLCVGIEDPADLLDDLERALLEAGAITLTAGADSHQRYVRTIPSEGTAISRAVQKLAYNESAGYTTEREEDREWFISAPGKVILFGEHAVVYGVVSSVSHPLNCVFINSVIDGSGCKRGSPVLWHHDTSPRW